MARATAEANAAPSGYPAAAAVPESLSALLGFHLRMAHTAMYRDFAASLEGLDLTQRQLAVLQIVGELPGVSQIQIAAMLSMDRPTIMAIVDRLESRGLLQRRRSTADRRRQELHLTERGEPLLARAKAAVSAHEQRFLQRFSPAEREALIQSLKRIYALE